jgi:hypothetical protein
MWVYKSNVYLLRSIFILISFTYTISLNLCPLTFFWSPSRMNLILMPTVYHYQKLIDLGFALLCCQQKVWIVFITFISVWLFVQHEIWHEIWDTDRGALQNSILLGSYAVLIVELFRTSEGSYLLHLQGQGFGLIDQYTAYIFRRLDVYKIWS